MTDAQSRVYDCLAKLGNATPNQIIESGYLEIGKVMLHRHLKRLHHLGLIERIGTPPHVYYRCIKVVARDALEQAIMDQHLSGEDLFGQYFAYMKNFQLLEGPEAFKEWFIGKQLPNLRKNKSRKRALSEQVITALLDASSTYLTMRAELEDSKIPELALFDGTPRYKSIHSSPIVKTVYYVDFYSLPVYGRSRLGHYIQKAKVGDQYSRVYIDRIAQTISGPINMLVAKHKVDALLWVPHSLKRQVGLMDELRRQLGGTRAEIKVIKAFPAEVIPQKSISDLQMRITNALASNHIMTSHHQLKTIRSVLIIDDAIGSNATIHGIATKLKQGNDSLEIHAIAPVGSFKGFDIIQDI